MQTFLDFIRDHPTLLAFVLLVSGVIIWREWDFRIRPAFIPKEEINSIVDDLIAKHGPDAESHAFGYEQDAWYRAETIEQGKWRRVRRELWRRYKAGEWK